MKIMDLFNVNVIVQCVNNYVLQQVRINTVNVCYSTMRDLLIMLVNKPINRSFYF